MKTINTASNPKRPQCDLEQDEMHNEREALALGLALVGAKYEGNSDFDKGMRLLQKTLGIKPIKSREN